MHIAQALVALNLGGSELVAMELAEYLQAHGHHATLLAASGPLAPRAAACGAAHLDWPIGKKRLGTLRYIARLARWLETSDVDVVHAHSRLPAWICWRAIRKLPAARRPAFITTMHGHYSVSPYSAVMAKGDLVLAVSDHIRAYTLENYPGVDPGRVRTVHGGISHADFPFGYQPGAAWVEQMHRDFPETRGKRLISLPGRLTRWKGHREFIILLGRIAAQLPDVHGLIIGGGRPGSSYHRELLQLAAREGVEARLTFTGATTEIRNWMAVSRLLFNLSANPPEALGRTVIEALSLGRPVLAWDHGGAGEILGHMYPQGKVALNDMDALAEKTLQMLQNPEPVPQSSAFGLQTSMQKHLEIYAQLVKGAS